MAGQAGGSAPLEQVGVRTEVPWVEGEECAPCSPGDPLFRLPLREAGLGLACAVLFWEPRVPRELERQR